MTRWWFIGCVLGLLTACSMAPVVKRPVMVIPEDYKESGHWVQIKPTQSKINAKWWMLFKDSALNTLEERVLIDNEHLKIACSRYQEAKALADMARSQFYPTITGVGGLFSRQQTSKNVGDGRILINWLYNTWMLGAFLNYEVDAWGRVRHEVDAMTHAARASRYDLATIRLSTQAELASLYFEWKGDTTIQAHLDAVVRADQRALYLIQHLHQGGALSALEEDEAVFRLERAKTAALNMRLMRAKLEHAMAVLVGEVPARFYLPKQASQERLHALHIAPSLPSTLLTRRPDIAAAAERVESANAMIGVARTAFFPQLMLSGLAGFQSKKISQLFTAPSSIWSVGPPSSLVPIPPEVTQVLFDGFYLQASLSRAKSRYQEVVSAYRQTVLTAFQDVEDSLVANHRLAQEVATQTKATQAAHRACRQAQARMQGGIVTYLSVVGLEVTALRADMALTQLQVGRQLASVRLLVALGGGTCIMHQFRDENHHRISMPKALSSVM